MSFLTVQTPKAQAHGGNEVGAVIAGLVTGAILADAFHPHTVYVSQPEYCAPPAPVVYYREPAYCPAPRVVYVSAPPVVYYREPVRVSFGWGWGEHRREHGYDHCR
ncbi:MAG: hypothetical protein RLZZ350_2129 [Verrucomicrobiota bacterium]